MLRKSDLSLNSDLRILGIDVCTGFCSAALIKGEVLHSIKHEPMSRGHAERLAPMVAEVLGEAGISPGQLDGIAVTTGPGSFTGARLGVSFARGLALAANIPVAGITVFDAMAYICNRTQITIALHGKNDSIFLQSFRGVTPLNTACEHSPDTAWQILPGTGNFEATGPEIEAVIASAPDKIRERCRIIDCAQVTSEILAKAAMQRFSTTPAPPAPLYLRAPDAKPQTTNIF